MTSASSLCSTPDRQLPPFQHRAVLLPKCPPGWLSCPCHPVSQTLSSHLQGGTRPAPPPFFYHSHVHTGNRRPSLPSWRPCKVWVCLQPNFDFNPRPPRTLCGPGRLARGKPCWPTIQPWGKAVAGRCLNCQEPVLTTSPPDMTWNRGIVGTG